MEAAVPDLLSRINQVTDCHILAVKAQADTQCALKAAGFIHKGRKCIYRNNIRE